MLSPRFRTARVRDTYAASKTPTFALLLEDELTSEMSARKRRTAQPRESSLSGIALPLVRLHLRTVRAPLARARLFVVSDARRYTGDRSYTGFTIVCVSVATMQVHCVWS
jgi:hypothetical protein